VADHLLFHPPQVLLLMPGAAHKLTPILQNAPYLFGFLFRLCELETDEIKAIIPAHEPDSATSSEPVGEPQVVALVNSTETFFSFCRSILEWAAGVQLGHMSMPTA